ncbi:mechanosensitive ion channel family protein [Marinobacter zhejiangensis]|uniref:Small-conductance mechanosensitive channel n=1 Tax=Marinobacter zhejiangensis TaxID=488535 RepID=A0A1I4QFU4_9GAMM|nr:mechanosensitive ion channel domain-containing protein [Marinobacter zhejiangensis]SFM38483.1 Mechanosensitive ion channel [Marinobacter zhejiangensis]
MDDFGLKVKDALSSLTSESVFSALALVLVASLLIMAIQAVMPRLAQKVGGKPRYYILASVPLLRLLIIVVTIVLVVPTLVEPTVSNMVAIFGTLGLALGFAFKDYVNSLIAGIVTLYEMPYRPGDWIEIGGHYGEVKRIGARAAEILTPDDTTVIIPHGQLWNALIANSNDGTDNLMCVARFCLEPNHNVNRVRELLRDVAYTSPLIKSWLPVKVVVSNSPYGMTYRVKAYPLAPRDQFEFTSDLTARGAEALAEAGVKFVTAPALAE